MKPGENPGAEAIETKGWWAAYKFLVLRRFSQLTFISLFLLGPVFGVWIVKGNLASSLTLDTLPLTDPLVLLQIVFAGNTPLNSAITGAAIVVTAYILLGGRSFCSWVCPVNIITDSAAWLRRKLKLRGGVQVSRSMRYWLLAAVLLLSALTGMIAWELVNPVSLVYRGLIFGMGFGWGIIAAVFFLDLIVGQKLWCGHLCPVGAFYSIIGKASILRVSAKQREACDDCMDCFAVCPEHKVIAPALKGAKKSLGPVILSGNCTNCGRCIDVCAEEVFTFTHRFDQITHRESDI